MIRRVRRNWAPIAAGALVIVTMIALGFALAWRSADQAALADARRDNCERIEAHKAFHRDEAAFDLEETREILVELGIDPDSTRGQELLERARRNALRDQARFASSEC